MIRVLFVDDIRQPNPDNFPTGAKIIVVRDYKDAIALLERGEEFWIWSLDHDMGNGRMNGVQFLNYIENTIHSSKRHKIMVPSDIRIHSANPVGANTMRTIVRRL